MDFSGSDGDRGQILLDRWCRSGSGIEEERGFISVGIWLTNSSSF
jgi:hypothetical protein